METKKIPGASKYAIDENGQITNAKFGHKVSLEKNGKVRLMKDDGSRAYFDPKELKEKLFSVTPKAEAKPETAATKKEVKQEKEKAPKVEKKAEEKKRGRTGTATTEIRELLEAGKTREQIDALAKYNPNTVRAQYYFHVARQKNEK